MRKKLAVVAVYGAVIAAVVAGTSAYVSLDKTVHVSVDGKITTVHSYARTVGAVLRRDGITVGQHDSLTPAASASVRDGSTITIERGRLLNLTVDGSNRQVWVTASSVDDALRQAGLRVPGAVVSVDRSSRVPLSGLAVDVELPHTITVQVDGSSHVLVTTQETVGDALAEAGIKLNPGDKVSSPVDVRPFDGLAVVITRIANDEVAEPSPVPFTTVTKQDGTLLVGTKKVGQQGSNGTLVRTYRVTMADGKQIAKTLIGQQITVQPVQQIVLIGTKPKPVPKPAPKAVFATRADGLNWAALARCESGGRPNAVSGPFYGLYQFRLGTWQAVGGSGLPSNASVSEQTYRAQLLYQRSNWQTQWPVCGHLLFS